MSITLFCPYFFHGGAEKQFRHLISSAIEQNLPISIIHVLGSMDDEKTVALYNKLTAAGIKVFFYGFSLREKRKSIFIYMRFLLLSLWRSRGCKHIYCYSLVFAPTVLLFKAFQKNVIYSERILSERVTKKIALNKIAMLANTVVVNGDTLFSYYSKLHKKVKLIRNIVEPIVWKVQHSNNQFPTIAVLSRYHPDKYLHFLSENMSFLTHTVGNLDIYGQDDDAAYKEKLINSVAEQNIKLNGPQSIDYIYNSHDFIVHPSLAEGCPNVLIECMASNKPVFASDIPENVDTGISSIFIYERHSIQSLVDKLNFWKDLPENEKSTYLAANKTVADQKYGKLKFDSEIKQIFS